MIDDRDVWQAAVLIVKRYCDDVMQVLEEGDMAGAEDVAARVRLHCAVAMAENEYSPAVNSGGKGCRGNLSK